MEKILKDRFNNLNSELKQLKQPKLGKSGYTYTLKIYELEIQLQEIKWLQTKLLKEKSKLKLEVNV